MDTRDSSIETQPLLVAGEPVVLTCYNPVCPHPRQTVLVAVLEAILFHAACASCGQYMFGMEELYDG